MKNYIITNSLSNQLPTVLCLLVILFLFAIYLSKEDKKQRNDSNKQQPRKETFTYPPFKIYNYLLKPVNVKILEKEGTVYRYPIPLATIQAQSLGNINYDLIIRYLRKGNVFGIYVVDGDNETLFSKYTLDIPEDTTIKMLHIGMVTSRWVGADSDYNIGSPGLNAVQGLPWIKIHNMTEQFLSINENINISPTGTLRYTGRDHFGVRLGTVFKDTKGIFPTFIFTIPATDVYYGVVSDIQQPLFGGFQLTPQFIDSDNEPQYLLENGWMGGPAKGKIPYGYLPMEGPQLSYHVNRWGEQESGKVLLNPVGPPVENLNNE